MHRFLRQWGITTPPRHLVTPVVTPQDSGADRAWIDAAGIGSIWTLLPFLSALIWAATIVIATWPLLLWVQRLFGGRRSLAAATMTCLVLLAVIAPVVVSISTLFETFQSSPAVITDFLERGLPPPPEWVAKLPFVGDSV